MSVMGSISIRKIYLYMNVSGLVVEFYSIFSTPLIILFLFIKSDSFIFFSSTKLQLETSFNIYVYKINSTSVLYEHVKEILQVNRTHQKDPNSSARTNRSSVKREI